MSANAYEEDVAASLKAGMNAHLAKPVEPQKMYSILADFWKKRNKDSEAVKYPLGKFLGWVFFSDMVEMYW